MKTVFAFVLLGMIAASCAARVFVNPTQVPRVESIAREGAGTRVVYRLSNGLPVVLVEDHWHPMIALEVCYRVGSRNDPYGKAGLAHLLEHLTFESPESVPPSDTMTIGKARATTNRDTTCYSRSFPREELQQALGAEARRMAAIDVRQPVLEREKAVIARERGQLVEGDTWRGLLEELDRVAFALHPYRFPVAGWPETLATISVADVDRHFAAYYAPVNAVLVAVGDFTTQGARSVIATQFEGVPARDAPEDLAVEEPREQGERTLLVIPSGRPRLSLGYRIPPFEPRPAAALRILASLLAGGPDGLLDRSLRGNGLAEAASVEYGDFNHDPDLFYLKIDLGARPEFGRAVDAVDHVLAHLAADGPEPARFARAKKRVLLGSYLDASSRGRAKRIAQYALLSTLKAEPSFGDEVSGISEGDLRRVVQTYFSPANRTVAMTGIARDGSRADRPEAKR